MTTRNVLPRILLFPNRTSSWLEDLRELRKQKPLRKRSKPRTQKPLPKSKEQKEKLSLLDPEMRKMLGL